MFFSREHISESSVALIMASVFLSFLLGLFLSACGMVFPAQEGKRIGQATSTPTPFITPSFTPTSTPTPLPATPVPSPTLGVERFELADLPALALPDWPRPAHDNGLGIHFMSNAFFNDDELEVNISRALEMNLKWAVVVYADGNQLERAARRFKEAGMVVVWRPRLFAYKHYPYWARDVRILREAGLPPYIQAYNEPSLDAEWEDGPSKSGDKFRANLRVACQEIYNAGGFIGLQFVHEKWLTDSLKDIKERGGEKIFGRMFFVAHTYGMNHPPDYTEDPNGVLGFLYWADILQKELGFVPPIIVGEGGWKYEADDDERFPLVDDKLHRDYHLEMFNWFRTGLLSNGQPLPDYLFAVCPWLISSKLDSNAWYDSFAGDRILTIEAVKAIPPFERKFTWNHSPQPDEARMVYIPAGKFIMGSTEEEVERAFQDCKERIGEACQRRWFEVESPKRTVDLGAFWIDRTEVTNAQYQLFLEANPDYPVPYLDEDWAKPYNWDKEKRTYPEGRANHPVVMVSWYDADAYCRWRQARLPAEAEWEKAARGTDGLTYPWGDEFDKDRCNIADSGIKDTVPVGKYSPWGDSPYGLADMAGNVWEWVADNYQGMTTRKVLRGGSWTSSPVSARAARRFYSEPVNRNDNIGFRCAKSEVEG